jgi:predicted membrane protein
VVGVVVLLDHLGIVSGQVLFRYWPVLLILWGFASLGRREGRAWGFILIMAGTVLQLNKLNILHVSLWSLWPLIFVAIGLMIIWNTLEGRKVGTVPAGDSTTLLNEVAVFSGIERRITNRQFQGGRLTSVFGGMEIDLSEAGMEGNEAVLDLNIVFGGCELRVPPSWNVALRVQPMFGGIEDRTRQSAPADTSEGRKTLYLKGTVVFGGVEIKN